MDIFDDINATNLGTYWTTKSQNTAPYLWDTLFPVQKQLSDTFQFYRGTSRAPHALAPSAFGVPAIMRDRQGYQKVTDRTRYFKEGKYIDENLRQELLRVQSNGSDGQKDIINNRIFADMAELLDGAILTQEIVRNQMVQTGKLNVFGNGQVINDVDYKLMSTHKVVNAKAWGTDGSKPFDDIDQAQYVVGNDSDQTITRAVMNRATFTALLHDENVKGTLFYDNGKLANVALPQSELLNYLSTQYGLEVVVYDKQYVDLDGQTKKWIPDGRVIFMPAGNLGNTVTSTTPEEADLLGTSAADVSLVNGGIAISTITTADPVNKKINVSQQFLPSFEQIDGIYILDAFATAAKDPTDYSAPAATGTQTTTAPKQ
ncbi:MAG TPA: major capsid protein E [Lactobacillus sp.]|nr:major capsid protein E [Lactobacillus sp.]